MSCRAALRLRSGAAGESYWPLIGRRSGFTSICLLSSILRGSCISSTILGLCLFGIDGLLSSFERFAPCRLCCLSRIPMIMPGFVAEMGISVWMFISLYCLHYYMRYLSDSFNYLSASIH